MTRRVRRRGTSSPRSRSTTSISAGLERARRFCVSGGAGDRGAEIRGCRFWISASSGGEVEEDSELVQADVTSYSGAGDPETMPSTSISAMSFVFRCTGDVAMSGGDPNLFLKSFDIPSHVSHNGCSAGQESRPQRRATAMSEYSTGRGSINAPAILAVGVAGFMFLIAPVTAIIMIVIGA